MTEIVELRKKKKREAREADKAKGAVEASAAPTHSRKSPAGRIALGAAAAFAIAVGLGQILETAADQVDSIVIQFLAQGLPAMAGGIAAATIARQDGLIAALIGVGWTFLLVPLVLLVSDETASVGGPSGGLWVLGHSTLTLLAAAIWQRRYRAA
jgi:hypothetical protein